jgi:hypothetical protein
MKGAARKNVAYPMNIDINSSTDDSDFVNPPLKKEQGPEQKVHNIPWQPPWQAATHTDREAVVKKTNNVLILLSTIADTKGYFCTVLKLLDTHYYNYSITYMLH